MSGDHFSGGKPPHEPVGFLPDQLMSDVERNVVYGCTDVVLRDQKTGKIFLGTRQAEPQLGPWLIGGRDTYGKGPNDNAAIQIKNDLGLDIKPSNFAFVTEYSTSFPAASPHRQDHGRHTKNSVMLLDMSPEQVALLNQRMSGGDIRDEYSHGAWYDPADITKTSSDFPDLLKQLVRDLHAYDRTYAATWDEAHEEDRERKLYGSPEDREKQILTQASYLQKQFDLSDDEAYQLAKTSGPNATYAIVWARTVNEDVPAGIDLGSLLDSILDADEYIGDYNVKRLLKENGVVAPEVYADNGPAMQAILCGGRIALKANDARDGALFRGLKHLKILGRAGVGPLDP